ncbi:MAG: cob(I)yrinic acid a,c-diamide adenosyltransferase [Patescibacteria group bacterium]
MKIYTKTGDFGETSLWGGKRVKKSDKIIEALGVIDELNAWLGTLKLTKIQKDLMLISSCLAGYKEIIPDGKWLEKEIDRIEENLPALNNFILPSNQIHIARAVCRRTERKVVDADGHRHDVLKYLNRLSDYLFVLARYEDFKKGRKEIIWRYGKRELLERVREGTGTGKRNSGNGSGES